MARLATHARNSILVILAGMHSVGPAEAESLEVRRVPVTVVAASEQSVRRSIQLAGTVTAEKAARLSVATSGLVTRIAVDAGDRVTAGDLLLELDAELARYQWQSAEADVSRAQQALSDARRRLDEAKRLAPQQSIAETAVRDLESEVTEDDASLQRAKALAGYHKGILERHRLLAPFDGVISTRYCDVGEWVTPGNAVLDLVSTDNLRLDFQVSEDYLGSLRENASVDFYLAGDSKVRHPGRILARVPVTDPTARTFLLRIVAKGPVADMLPGMSVNAEVKLDTGRRGVVVPRDAVLRYSDGRAVVWVAERVNGEDRAAERLVETGLNFDGVVEITRGIQVGERIVIEGNEALRGGELLGASAPEAY